jgi:hypothetical protein
VQLFERALHAAADTPSPRAWAFALIGIHEYFRRLSGDRLVNQIRETLTSRLLELYEQNASDDWQWFEPKAAYDNAKAFLQKNGVVIFDEETPDRIIKVVDSVPSNRNRVFFGAWVTIGDEQGEEQEYRIVGADESDAGKRYISVDSPLARALLGKAVDDEVVVELPGGAASGSSGV